MRRIFQPWAFALGLFLSLVVMTLMGCTPTPVVQVQGNGFCHPSADLPVHKEVAPVPETDTPMDGLYGLLAAERKAHGADDRDYNSLYTQCVGAPQ